MNRPAVQIKTPGAAAQTPAPNEAAAEAEALEAMVASTDDLPAPPAAPAVPEAVAGAPADLKAYIDEQIAKGVAAGMKQIARSQLKASPESAAVPDQSEVDPRKIRDITLTKQGYVIPHDYGKVPQHIATQIQLGQAR